MNQQDFERFLYRVRTWTGLSLIALITLQIVTGYALLGKVDIGFIPYQTTRFVHTQFSWILVYFVLTHATINLRFLFRRWWPKYEVILVKGLVVIYILATLTTFYFHFLK